MRYVNHGGKLFKLTEKRFRAALVSVAKSGAGFDPVNVNAKVIGKIVNSDDIDRDAALDLLFSADADGADDGPESPDDSGDHPNLAQGAPEESEESEEEESDDDFEEAPEAA